MTSLHTGPTHDWALFKAGELRYSPNEIKKIKRKEITNWGLEYDRKKRGWKKAGAKKNKKTKGHRKKIKKKLTKKNKIIILQKPLNAPKTSNITALGPTKKKGATWLIKIIMKR